MRILYVISTPIEYSSSANMRNVALIKGLIENGNQVDIVSDGYNKQSKFIDFSICNVNFNKRYYLRRITDTKENVSKGALLNTVKLNISKFVSKLSVYDNRKVLVSKAKRIELTDKYDVMISSSDPKSSHVIAKKILQKHSDKIGRWIQYWGDPFALDINKTSLLPRFAFKESEKKILSMADKIIYVSPFTLNKQKELYPELSKKMYFLPIPYSEKKIYRETHNSVFSIGYFGDYNSNDRNIIPLYHAVQKLNVKMDICGNSDLVLKSKDGINIFGRQSQSKIRTLEANEDLLIVICNKKGTQIPGKIYHYAATNKPILVVLDGDLENKQAMKEYILNYNRFEICENSEEDIIKKIYYIQSKTFNCLPQEELYCRNIASEIIK